MIVTNPIKGQDIEAEIAKVESALRIIDLKKDSLKRELESLKLDKISIDLKKLGLPSEDYIEHSAMILSYNEHHEQANWVAHVISPQIINGTVFRSNDFRVDPKVTSGTAVEEDYFLKFLKADSTYEYDGFGFDRGHLAPSADFRWSAKALSESYYYSNMSPQHPDFNRGTWAELENNIRSYVSVNKNQLYIITLPLLNDKLRSIERSINKISIPEHYIKVVLDPIAERGIAFYMENKKLDYPASHYAISIDEAEKLSGYDFFNGINDDIEEKIESSFDKKEWFPDLAFGDVDPLKQEELASGQFNTIVAARYIGKTRKIQVCGKVVSTRYSRSGNFWMNLDKNFPNQIFSVYIRKKDLVNYSYDIKSFVENRNLCFEGKVEDLNGTPTMNIDKESAIIEFK